jgi:hypothetical protein
MTVVRRMLVGTVLAAAVALVTVVGTAAAAPGSCHDGPKTMVTYTATPADGCPNDH